MGEERKSQGRLKVALESGIITIFHVAHGSPRGEWEMRESLPDLTTLSHAQKDALILELWDENVRLRREVEFLRGQVAELVRRILELEAKLNRPPKDSSNSSLPPSKDQKEIFLGDATIPPTNKSSEKDLRPSKTFMKVTNGFRSDWGKHLYEGVRSVINTGRRHGLNAYQAIKRALSSAASFFNPYSAPD
jgi:hypothetical protein